MRNIDLHTKHLVAWLGETNDDSSQAIRIIPTISSELQQADFSEATSSLQQEEFDPRPLVAF
jgi:hypothetical protein